MKYIVIILSVIFLIDLVSLFILSINWEERWKSKKQEYLRESGDYGKG